MNIAGKKTGILILILSIIFIVLARSSLGQQVIIELLETTKYNIVEEKILKIKPEMTRKEVNAIMQMPVQILFYEFKGGDFEQWAFPHSATVSEVPRCIFDNKTGKVVKVVYEY